eukprot:756649-Hanusia_phi.AAC.5
MQSALRRKNKCAWNARYFSRPSLYLATSEHRTEGSTFVALRASSHFWSTGCSTSAYHCNRVHFRHAVGDCVGKGRFVSGRWSMARGRTVL